MGRRRSFTFGHARRDWNVGLNGISIAGVLSVVLMAVEFLGGAALVLGFLTRWAAALNAFDMVVAILMVHLKNGFFQPQRFRVSVDLLAACIVLACRDPERSVDGALAKRSESDSAWGWQTPKSFDIVFVSQRKGLPASFGLIFFPCKVSDRPA